MFRIITDPEEAADFGRAGILWWVSKADGGSAGLTCLFGHYNIECARYVAANSHRRIFGVQVDE